MNQTPPPDQQPRPPAPVQIAVPRSRPYVTYSLLGLTIVIFLLQMAARALFGEDPLTVLGAKYGPAIRLGQIWRLLTPVFLHASIYHIFFNMYALLVYGQDVEARFGHVRFLLLYFLSAYAGNILSFLLTPGVSIGASTAVFGLIAAEAGFFLQNRRLFGRRADSVLLNLAIIGGINLFLGFTTEGIDNWGHLGGLLGGIIFTWFGGPQFKIEGVYPLQRLVDERQGHGAISGSFAVLLFFTALAVLGWAWGG
jgi:rhomboid protease GluP